MEEKEEKKRKKIGGGSDEIREVWSGEKG